MSISIKVSTTYQGSGSSLNSVLSTLSVDSELIVSAAIPANAVNKEIDLSFLVATVQAVAMVPDTGDLTVKTNSTGSPQETLTLSAGVGLVWASGLHGAVPFAGNITKFYVSNAGAAIVNLSIRIALNTEV